MARQADVECPTGLRLKMRSVKGKDIDGLRDKRRINTGEALTELLMACTVEVVDTAVYSGLSSFHWADALLGDRFAALIGLRRATAGDMYEFKIRCGVRGCNNNISWEVNLTELDVQPLPEASRLVFAENNEFITEVDGREVVFGLTTGRDQLRIAKIIEKDKGPKRGLAQAERALYGLLVRIQRVNGVEPKDVMAWLDDLDLADINALRKSMDDVDCGIETEILVDCSGPKGCGTRQNIDLPLDENLFLV